MAARTSAGGSTGSTRGVVLEVGQSRARRSQVAASTLSAGFTTLSRSLMVEVRNHIFTGLIETSDVFLPTRDEIRIGVADRAVRDAGRGVKDVVQGPAAEDDHFWQQIDLLQGRHFFHADDTDPFTTFGADSQRVQLPSHIRCERRLDHAYPVKEGAATFVLPGEREQVLPPFVEKL